MRVFSVFRVASREWVLAVLALLACLIAAWVLTDRLRVEADRAAAQDHEELEAVLVAQTADRVATLLRDIDVGLDRVASDPRVGSGSSFSPRLSDLAVRGATFFLQNRRGQLLHAAAGTEAGLAHALAGHLHHVSEDPAHPGRFSACSVCAAHGMLTASRAAVGQQDLLVTAALDQRAVYRQIFAPISGQHDAYVWLVARDGRLLAGPPGALIGEQAFASLLPTDELPRMLQHMARGERGVGSFFWPSGPSASRRLAAFAPIPGRADLAVLYSTSESSLLARTRRIHVLARRLVFSLLLLEGLALLGLLIDARRRHRRQVVREAQRAEVQRLADFGRLVASVGHELRNPLTLASLSTEAAIEALVEDPPELNEARDALDDASIGIRQMREVVATLGALSRREQPVARHDLAALLSTAMLLAKPQLQRHDVSTRVPENLWVDVAAGRATQVILNLLVNAAQAASEGERRGRVAIHAGVADGVVFLEVADDGPGVADAMRDDLFTPFATSKVGGTGLGLPISREIAEQYGGSLKYVPMSTGACFRFELPSAELVPATAPVGHLASAEAISP